MLKHTVSKSGNVFLACFLEFILSLLAIPHVTKGYCSPIPQTPIAETYSTGTYSDSIVANGRSKTTILSGRITINYAVDAPGTAALFATDYGSITGTVDNLTIRLLKQELTAIRTNYYGTTTLTGPVTITGQGEKVEGLSSLRGDSIHITGPVRIELKGAFSQGIGAKPGEITIDGPLFLSTDGDYAEGLFVRYISKPAVMTFNGLTEIRVSGTDAVGISGMGIGSIVYIHNALTLSASDNAWAIKSINTYSSPTATNSPGKVTLLTTRSSASSPEPAPQVINIDGKISIQGEYNQLDLDLDSGSHINSPLLETANKGNFQLHFHKPNAKLTTGAGSTVRSGGSLVLDFVNGGVWVLPLSKANRIDNDTPVAPFTIGRDGNLVIQGHGTLSGQVLNPIGEGEQATYLLVQKDITDSPLPLDLSQMTATTDQSDYSLSLESHNEGSKGYLYGILTRDSPPIVNLIPDNVTLTRTLPVTMIDQNLASLLLANITRLDDCASPHNVMAVDPFQERCSNAAESGLYPWLLPFYVNGRARNLDLGALQTGYTANIRGLAAGFIHESYYGRWGLGLWTANGDMDSRGDIAPVTSHADYLGGLLFGNVFLKQMIASAALMFMNSDHRLRQHSTVSNLKSESDIDIWSGQAGLSLPLWFQTWTLTPGIALSYWHTRQHSGEVVDQLSGQVYGNDRSTQGYWRLPLSLSISTVNPIMADYCDISLMPEIGLRFVPSWGDRDLPVTVWRKDQPEYRLKKSSVHRDRYSIEADIAVRFAGKYLDSSIRYSLSGTRHTLTQQIYGEISYRF